MDAFGIVEEGAPDIIFGLAAAYRADPYSQKVDLGIGAFRTDAGAPHVFDVVKRAERDIVSAGLNKEYQPIDGMAELKEPTQRLIFGSESEAVAQKRIATVQSISGTGALRVAAGFIQKLLPRCRHVVYLSRPTWPNHANVFTAAGLEVREYTYWDAASLSINMAAMITDLQAAPEGSSVVLQTCAHNPTGIDPTLEEWKAILGVVKAKNFLPIFDHAYQGYASGDLERDASALPLFVDAGVELLVAQSFAKNFGLYGERVGMMHAVCKDAETARVVMSQVKPVIRYMYGSPPLHGARIVHRILTDEKMRGAWEEELRHVSARIVRMRILLRDALTAKTNRNWDHVTNQTGMFSFTGISTAACERLLDHWHIYLLKNGRISLAGLNSKNIDYVVNAIADAVALHP